MNTTEQHIREENMMSLKDSQFAEIQNILVEKHNLTPNKAKEVLTNVLETLFAAIIHYEQIQIPFLCLIGMSLTKTTYGSVHTIQFHPSTKLNTLINTPTTSKEISC